MAASIVCEGVRPPIADAPVLWGLGPQSMEAGAEAAPTKAEAPRLGTRSKRDVPPFSSQSAAADSPSLIDNDPKPSGHSGTEASGSSRIGGTSNDGAGEGRHRGFGGSSLTRCGIWLELGSD